MMKIGKIAESVLKRSVLKQVKVNQESQMISGAAVGADCAIFAFQGADFANVATCVQEAAVAGKADMERLLHKVANGLVCAGALPIAAMISLVLPESVEEAEIKELMTEAQKVCSLLGMIIAGGQTNVWPDVSKPHVSVTGIGSISKDKTLLPGGAKPGQDIVISKWVGLEGTAMVANFGAQQMTARYPLFLIEEACSFGKYISVLSEAEIALENGVSALHDISEGGIFRALWEVAESAGVGLQVDLKKIPIRQETIEVCEFFQINPYELLSGGSLIMITDDGEALVQKLAEAEIPATVVGKITAGNDRVIINEDETRFLDRPRTDEIYKVEALWKK